MDFVKDIENYHYYWVEKIKTRNEPTLWGIDIGEKNIDLYKGPVAFISATDRWEGSDVKFGWGHVHSRGFYRTTLSDDPIRYLEPPFLIATNTDMRFIRSQEIEFVPAEKWNMLYDDSIPVEDFVVCRPDWVGCLRVDKRKSRTHGELWIFSDRNDIALIPGEPIYFADGTPDIFVHLAADSSPIRRS